MKKQFPLSLFAVMGFTLIAPVFADQVVMRNGDRVSGAFVKKDAKTLTIKSEFFGVVTLPWDQIQSVKADTPITVEMAGQTVQGTLLTTGDKVEVVSGADKREVAPADIVALRNADEQKAYERLLAPRLADLWAGTASIGWAGTSGNAKTATFATGMNAARVTKTDKLFVYFNSIKASATVNKVNAGTAQAVRGGWGYNRNLKPRIFFNGFNDWEYDRFQNLDLRTVIGAGLGANVWKAERGRFDLVGGMAYNREKFDPIRPALPFVRNGAEAYWGDDFNYKLNARTSLFQGFRMFNNVKVGERWRMNFDAGATTQLTKWMTWNLSISDRFLNLPVAGRMKNDFLYTTGIGFAFAK
jgi:putative salt-induced outer membrane protein YdiY